jgi:uncharacterized glyoxalase superfamily protein PhnB
MKFMGPLILVEDIERSRAFYEETLRQTVKYNFGVNVSFEGGLAVHLRTHFEERAKIVGSRKVMFGSNSLSLTFTTDEIDKIYRELKGLKVEFLHEIEEQPWGQRVMRFYDPDKHIVAVGEAMEGVVARLHRQGLSLDEVAARTGMPIEFVEAAMQD